MAGREIHALRRWYQALVLEIDPVQVSTILSARHPRLGSLHEQLCEEIRCRERQQVNLWFLTKMVRNVGYIDFVDALDECGYKIQATEMVQTFLSLNTNIEVINRSVSGQRPILNDFANFLKTWVDNTPDKNPDRVLRRIGKQWTFKMQNEENITKKRRLADECVVIKGAEIDAVSITNNKNICKKDLFKSLHCLRITRAMRYCQMAFILDVLHLCTQ